MNTDFATRQECRRAENTTSSTEARAMRSRACGPPPSSRRPRRRAGRRPPRALRQPPGRGRCSFTTTTLMECVHRAPSPVRRRPRARENGAASLRWRQAREKCGPQSWSAIGAAGGAWCVGGEWARRLVAELNVRRAAWGMRHADLSVAAATVAGDDDVAVAYTDRANHFHRRVIRAIRTALRWIISRFRTMRRSVASEDRFGYAAIRNEARARSRDVDVSLDSCDVTLPR